MRIDQTFVSLAGGAGVELRRMKSKVPLADVTERFGAYCKTRGSLVQSMTFPESAGVGTVEELHAARVRAQQKDTIALAFIYRVPLILWCATDEPLQHSETFSFRRLWCARGGHPAGVNLVEDCTS
jgi:hypothetical protein